MQRGKFIVIEGSDGAGKNTQKTRLTERLQDIHIPVEEISFPQYGTATGDIIGDCYLGKGNRVARASWFENADSVDPKIASLYYAADRLSAKNKILNYLIERKNVISDRYVESNMGHQGGKIRDKKERNKLVEWIENLEYGLLELPRTDLVIFLYLPYENARESAVNRSEHLDGHESNETHLRNAEECYLELAQKYNWTTVNCMRGTQRKTILEVHQEIFSHVMKILK